MTRQEILDSNQTKTWKIQQLLGLGLTRREVSSLMGVGYGFVQNIYARTFPENIRTRNTILQAIEQEIVLRNFAFNHTFGVEIEAFGIKISELVEELTNAGISIMSESYNHTTRSHWKIVTDSSLRGENAFELVSPKLKGTSGLKQLKTVTLILKGLETKVNKTCGLHIHFDASEFDLKTWKRLYKNYAKLEMLIDSWMPNSRRMSNNNYCMSLRVPNFESKINAISESLNLEAGLKKLEQAITHSDRRFKLNSQSYWRQRSVEFRQHSGTVQFEKIQNWIIFLARLVEYSKLADVRTEDWSALNNFLSPEQIQFFRRRAQELAA